MNLTEQKTRTLQAEVQKTLRNRKFPWRVDGDHFVDGEPGKITYRTAGFAAYCQGAPGPIVKKLHEGDITPATFAVLTHKKERPASWKKEAEKRKPQLRKLREAHRKMIREMFDGAGTVEIDGEQVPKWIAKDVLKIRKRGNWTGVIVSGFRTPEYSEQLCIAMCGAVSCPGRCAGRATNHACPPTAKCRKPEGAIDVSDYVTFGEECRAIGSVLHNSLGAQDPVHYSAAGN